MNGVLNLRAARRPVRPAENGTAEAGTTQPSEPAIVSRGLTKEFGRGETRVLALRGADFEAQPGAITMLVGPSGCGKTTLASIVAGLLDPTDGELHVLGHDIRRLSPAALVAFTVKV